MHRVRSGHSPAGLERIVYSKLLQDAQADMDRCQTELRRLTDLSKEITRQQELLEAYMAGIRCIMSPIYTLPQEILGEIFKYVCCSGNIVGVNCIPDSYYPYDQRMPTLTISRVCIRWYNLVTTMPVLWSSFGTRDLNSSYTPFFFKLFLERSHLHPICHR
ncbi:hypothetical protein BT96DRAFT_984300 [Gymnopus androsaceus JB14]|uniref:Uncharacterized protein n=1 Tax=Gymnopus androsaceus JB14 TaxID=1447944 RepID=A0A6A4INN6_9AGAR|nr:hypothetical protein BT96DRAFT_984300 [Gymnopus androsaceus JB14]